MVQDKLLIVLNPERFKIVISPFLTCHFSPLIFLRCKLHIRLHPTSAIFEYLALFFELRSGS